MNNVKLILSAVLLAASIVFSGCTVEKEETPPDFMVINGEEISAEEFNIYLKEAVKSFEEIGGYDIWETDFDGRSAVDVVKESALNSMTAVKITAQKANDFNISLTEDEEKQTARQAPEYLEAYGMENTESNIKLMQKVLNDEMLYSKVRQYVVKDYAISEAEYEAYYKSYYESTAAGLRQIKLKGIFCTEEEKINEVYGRFQNGDDFEELYNEYNVSEIAWGDGGNITLHQNELEGEWGEFIGVEEGFISKPEEINNGFVVFRVMEIKESSREEVIAKLREDYTNSVWQNIFSAEFEKWQMESSIYRNEEAWNKIEVDV